MSKNKTGVKKSNTYKKSVDLEFLRTVTGSDTQFEKELFVIFLDSAKNNITKMEKAIANTDDHSWHMASHSFKGAASAIGAFDLSKALEYAQTHPKENYDAKAKVLDNIKEEFAKVSEFINQELLK